MSHLIALAGVGPHHVISHGEVVGELVMLAVAIMVSFAMGYGMQHRHD